LQIRQRCKQSRRPLGSIFVRAKDVVDGHLNVSAESEESDTTIGSCFGDRNDYSHQNAVAVTSPGTWFYVTHTCTKHFPSF